ncbi:MULTISPECIES: carbonic anhydrase [Curtobacterium]|uniref:Carbonic anhydrase n=1 Tax=Curtobacterium herbarum TaxID=150122 RepID=A0ABP4JZW6_9MICO|nr:MULTISPECIES: carbonic anhydrase [Curtobacterium]MBM7476283.1 carbonic anhydrase [Curtobacterium herbarum]MBY0177465.1 carbonic anhydrase [Curtobacterium herbarum]MCP1504485.1 carbonic anhydrase [Curtobacterium herbarum]MCS6544150.1 carbonic anhydrase [Curtobacterium herbarum]MDY1003304.1 carbonic anhydrase [Curtobacterium sp. CFBP9011]
MTDRAASTPADALRLLVEGNARFAADKRRTGRIDPERRSELQGSQAPFATVLGCSDSRVPFEHVFDAGIGDVFAIRNAGQIVDDVVLGSIEFAVVALGTPLVVVLRHTKCGAVAAARSGEPVPAPHLQALVDAIAPSVERVRATDPDVAQESVGAAHLESSLKSILDRSGAVSDAIADGRLAVVGATYDLTTGEVSIDTVVGQA